MGFYDDLRYTRHIVLQKNLPILILLVVILVIGVTIGTVATKTIDYPLRQDLFGHLTAFLEGFEEELDSRNQGGFLHLLFYQIKVIFFIWVLGLSIIGLPFIPAIIFLRGFVIGFTMGFLIDELSFNGFFFALASLFPQNLIFLPLYIFSALISIAFSWNLISSLLKRRVIDFWHQFTGYSLLMLLCGTGFIIACFVEYYLSPSLMNLAANMLFKGNP